jgi:MFS family permease
MTRDDSRVRAMAEADGPSAMTLPVILLVSSLTVMASATIAPALPGLRDHYADVPDAEMLSRVILTAPGLAIALAAPLVGWVADRFGRRRVILLAMVLYVLAGGAGLVLDSISAMIGSRLVLGLAVAGMLPTASALIADFWHGPARDRAFGIQAAFMAAGGVVFLPLGGLLAQWHWRGPFLVYLLPVLLLPVAYAVIRDAPKRSIASEHAVDAGGFPLVLALGLWFVAFLGMVLFYLLPVQLPFLLIEFGAVDPWIAGAVLAVNTAISAVASLNFRRIRAFAGPRRILSFAFFMIGLGFVLVATADGLPMAVLGLCCSGPGLGLMFPAISTWLMARTPARTRARATGGMTTAVFLGQFLSPILAQPIAERVGLSGVFAGAAGVSIAFACLLAVLVMVLPPVE